MSRILSGTARDAIDAANRKKYQAEKARRAEEEIPLPGWKPPEPPPMVMRRIVDRRHASGHKVLFKLVPLENND